MDEQGEEISVVVQVYGSTPADADEQVSSKRIVLNSSSTVEDALAIVAEQTRVPLKDRGLYAPPGLGLPVGLLWILPICFDDSCRDAGWTRKKLCFTTTSKTMYALCAVWLQSSCAAYDRCAAGRALL